MTCDHLHRWGQASRIAQYPVTKFHVDIMKISLISLYPDITSFGLRTISAYLREKGHATQMIFLPDPYGDDITEGLERYQQSALQDVVELCRGSDLIGITLMTNFFDGAVQVTRFLKSHLSTPIIWGGVHPTIRPAECLEHADIVCVGDGEEALHALAERMASGRTCTDISNLWVKTADGIARNPVGPLTKDLDSFPLPDYSMDDHHIMVNDRVVSLTSERTKEFLERGTVATYLKKIGYQTMTGRGCPHKCTYCINDTIKNLYRGQSYIRWRSNDHVMAELLWVREHMPWVGFVWISDDAFFARSSESIAEFCREYKEKINLPFSALASPLTMSEKKMELLIDAGLIYVQMGIQSGSPRIQELFNRKTQNNKRILEAARIINKYQDRMFPPSYDFILDVPYENDQDKIDSLRLIAELPKPFKLQPFSLVLYPGTKLYQMARDDGFIADERRDIYTKTYTKSRLTYLNVLILLSKTGRFPAPLLKLCLAPPLLPLLNSTPVQPLIRLFYRVTRFSYRFLKHLAGRA